MMWEKKWKELKIKFNTISMIAREELPFTKFTSHILLIKKKMGWICASHMTMFKGCIEEEAKLHSMAK